MDGDYIIAIAIFAVVALVGGVLLLNISIRDKLGTLSKRLDAQTQRITRLTEWLEGQGKAKRKTKDDDNNAKT